MSHARVRLKPVVAAGAATCLTAAAIVAGLATDASAATSTFTPVADTFIRSTSASTNFGTSSAIEVDNSPIQHIYMKFSVSNLTAAVTSAKLRMHAKNVSGANSNMGGAFKGVSNTTWSETGMTYNNKPAMYPGASHQMRLFGRPSHRIDIATRTVEWVQRHIPSRVGE